MDRDIDLVQCLKYIDPSNLSYSEWVSVGMALKEAGYTAVVWEEWSSRDLNEGRYNRGECTRKWESFHGDMASKVTAGTIVKMAQDNGWRPHIGGHALDWDDVIEYDERIIDKNWIEGRDVTIPEEWDPAGQLITYLTTLFSSDDNVGYVTRSWKQQDGKDAGRDMPTKGCWDRTAGQLIQALSKCDGDIGAVLGDYSPDVGAWIRFNPLDGKGVRNENVTDFRYALVECDDMPIEKQNEIVRSLELPVAALVHSGGKSLHAIVRIEAGSYDEYRHRVDFLYDICRKNGLQIDSQNRNPSRLSRMPGVMRKGQKQYLVDTNIGKGSFTEWQEWYQSTTDNLPEPESLASVWGNMPELAPPLIDGVLRKGHKMLLVGPSKAGKSFALIELCVALAEGKSWFGWPCAQGRVLYVNLELDRPSCLHRFEYVYNALGWPPRYVDNIDIWNLRGKSVPMDQLAPKLIRRAAKKEYAAIIIDPIYKVITGDENSADQMAAFCNQFDRICTELGCAVIYCHHHSKGNQGGKNSMDRASGSGVFARDPDAIIDMIELDLGEAIMEQRANSAVAKALAQVIAKRMRLEDAVSQDDLCSAAKMREACKRLLDTAGQAEAQQAQVAAQKSAAAGSAWRIAGTLREFPRFDSFNLWFSYPVHEPDASGALADIELDASTPGNGFSKYKKKSPAQKLQEKNEELDRAFSILSGDGEVTISGLMDFMTASKNTVRDRIDRSGKYTREGGIVKWKQQS